MRDSNIRARRNIKFLKRFSRSEEIFVRLTWSAFRNLNFHHRILHDWELRNNKEKFLPLLLARLANSIKIRKFQGENFPFNSFERKVIALNYLRFSAVIEWDDYKVSWGSMNGWVCNLMIPGRFWFSDCHATFQRWDVWSHWLSKVMTKVIKLSQLKDEKNFRKASLDQSFQTF